MEHHHTTSPELLLLLLNMREQFFLQRHIHTQQNTYGHIYMHTYIHECVCAHSTHICPCENVST